MEQRPLRLGDIVDDYCPRERRITNHVIVAIVNEEIRQTRCSTCEAEHTYKAAKVPRRRKPDGADGVAAGEVPGQLVTPRGTDADAPVPEPEPMAEVSLEADAPVVVDDGVIEPPPDDQPAEAAPADDVWHTHRRLIRATLPRTESDPPPPRPIPEFTMHQRPGRGHQGRSGQWKGNGNADGNGHGRPDRHGRGNPSQHGHGNGQAQGHGRPGGRSGGRHRGGHKRSR